MYRDRFKVDIVQSRDVVVQYHTVIYWFAKLQYTFILVIAWEANKHNQPINNDQIFEARGCLIHKRSANLFLKTMSQC